jgi:hypothetical protein
MKKVVGIERGAKETKAVSVSLCTSIQETQSNLCATHLYTSCHVIYYFGEHVCAVLFTVPESAAMLLCFCTCLAACSKDINDA